MARGDQILHHELDARILESCNSEKTSRHTNQHQVRYNFEIKFAITCYELIQRKARKRCSLLLLLRLLLCTGMNASR